MADTNRKLIVVLGATGAQGNPVAKYLLKHSAHLFRLRAVTRDSTKPTARELVSLGAEVVEADFDNESSLASALSGANAIFAITNFWDKASYDLEITQGKLVNKLASQIPELESYIFSGLADGRKLAGGKFQNILPYNAKAEIREDIERYEALCGKTTEVFVAYYYQNWLKYTAVFGPQKDENGTFILSMPFSGSLGIPTSWADDVGPVVDRVLKSGDKYHGKVISLVGEIISHEDMLSVWAKQLGVKAFFRQVSVQEHVKRMKKSGLPDHLAVAVTELSEALVLEADVMEDEDLVKGRELIPEGYKLKSWKEYVKEEDWSAML